METDLVFIKKNTPVTTTLIVAEGMGIKHNAVMQLVGKYVERFEKKGQETFQFLKLNSTGGRPAQYADLNEENSVFLCSLMRNSDIVVEFKDRLSAAFVRHRKMLSELYSQKKSAEWIEQRNSGKLLRREEMDIVRQFVQYANDQGSKNADHYYSNLTRMENQALFLIMEKFPNLREVMDVSQLVVIGAADQIVAKALRDGMAEGMNYKEIYQKAKAAVMAFSEVIGKSPLPKLKAIGNGSKKQIELF